MDTFEKPHRSLERKRGLFLRIGLACSLLITFVAFEWRTPVAREEIIIDDDQWSDIEYEEMPITYRREEQLMPPPPVPINRNSPPQPQPGPGDIHIIPDGEPVVNLPSDSGLVIIDIPRIEEKDTAEIPLMRMPEVEPEFPGGEAALIKFIQSSVRYPENARAEGIQENVYVNFIVDEKGKVTNVECMGNPNKWLKEEALRIINLMPLWKPGKQGGRPVRVILNQPIYFKLK